MLARAGLISILEVEKVTITHPACFDTNFPAINFVEIISGEKVNQKATDFSFLSKHFLNLYLIPQ